MDGLKNKNGNNNNNNNKNLTTAKHKGNKNNNNNNNNSSDDKKSLDLSSSHRRRTSRKLSHNDSKVGLNEIICGDLKNPNLVRIEVPLGKPIEEVYEGVHDGPVLGSGISGIVRLVKHRATQVAYAVKCLDLALIDSEEGLRQLKEEIYIMCQLVSIYWIDVHDVLDGGGLYFWKDLGVDILLILWCSIFASLRFIRSHFLLTMKVMHFHFFVPIQDHPNIVRLEEVYESHSEIYLVQEVCKGGELFDRLDEQVSSQWWM